MCLFILSGERNDHDEGRNNNDRKAKNKCNICIISENSYTMELEEGGKS